LLFRRYLGADLLDPVLAHFLGGLGSEQLVYQGIDGVCDVLVDVAALSGAFYEGCCELWLLRKQLGVAVSFAIDELF
jgi:hypothetical protein